MRCGMVKPTWIADQQAWDEIEIGSDGDETANNRGAARIASGREDDSNRDARKEMTERRRHVSV